MEKRNLEELEQNIGYKFTNIKLLQNALTHTSYAYEHGKKSNEKLEFLGDSILEFVSSEYMYNKYLNLQEGQLTKVRATVHGLLFGAVVKSVFLDMNINVFKLVS